MKTVEFLRQTCLVLENGSLRLLVAQSVGPRLLALHLHQGENLLAEVPDATLECPGAPWAITQLKTFGVAILPQPQASDTPTPNRALVLWPHTDLGCPSLRLGNGYLLVHARMTAPFKIGLPNPRGWLAYRWNDLLFVKRAPFDPQAVYYDSGSSSECYCNDRFDELETLGPATMLAPGQSVPHLETWGLYGGVPCPSDEEAVQGLADALHLEG